MPFLGCALSFQAFNGLSPFLGRERKGKGMAWVFCGIGFLLFRFFLGLGNSGKADDFTVVSIGKKALAFVEMVACLLATLEHLVLPSHSSLRMGWQTWMSSAACWKGS
ncbi:hypothetical protein B0T14DRAFT_6384 [Immersiella caudata]|uniref:Uncharacterized protein n=1 Tax=Immersiella caudata TaxID=314043 RepID=A0AA40CBP1_9PEZI|nr:hypothetical protein B0T14DRAFT_6384 [Immersiella caudata]